MPQNLEPNAVELLKQRSAFEQRVRYFRHLQTHGFLLPCPVAVHIAGYSRARLLRLVELGRVKTVAIEGRPYVLFESLVRHRRLSFRRRLST